jgi:hypothetical protein
MHVLVGLALVCGLLYFWLVANWFARVLVFLLLTLCFGFIGGLMITGGANGTGWIVGLLGGGVVAWFVAGIPAYCWRYHLQQLEERLREQCNANAARQRWNPMSGRYEYR